MKDEPILIFIYTAHDGETEDLRYLYPVKIELIGKSVKETRDRARGLVPDKKHLVLTNIIEKYA